jgi:hypothetical protein
MFGGRRGDHKGLLLWLRVPRQIERRPDRRVALDHQLLLGRLVTEQADDVGLPIVRTVGQVSRIERGLPISKSGEFATRQWIDIFPDREPALRRLVETIREVPNAPATAEGDSTLIAATPPSMVDGAPAPAIPSPAEKRARAVSATIVAPDSPEFEAIRALLARHIGPIAKVFVQKAATEARTPDDFCERLAAHVSTPSDRAAFLQTARARLAIKA